MATITINEVNFAQDTLRTTANRAIPATSRNIQVTLTSSQWAAKAGTGSVTIGIEMSPDGNAPWEVLTGITVPIGLLNKGTLMPTFGATVGRAEGMLGFLRLFGIATVAIRMGASVEITAES